MGIILKITTKKSDLNITTEHFQGVKSTKSIRIAFSRLTCLMRERGLLFRYLLCWRSNSHWRWIASS